MPIDWSRLTEPFAPDDVEWKPGATTRDKKKGLAMAYITARAVQQRLDEVFGPGSWKNEFRSGPEGGVICRIYFKNDDGEWVWREDGADNTEVEAVKGGLSNAMKRAGAALGIGRYLHDLPSQWVPLDERGRFAEPPRVPARYLPRGAGQPQRPRNAGSPASNAGPRPQSAPRQAGDARGGHSVQHGHAGNGRDQRNGGPRDDQRGPAGSSTPPFPTGGRSR